MNRNKKYAFQQGKNWPSTINYKCKGSKYVHTKVFAQYEKCLIILTDVAVKLSVTIKRTSLLQVFTACRKMLMSDLILCAWVSRSALLQEKKYLKGQKKLNIKHCNCAKLKKKLPIRWIRNVGYFTNIYTILLQY